MELQNAFEICGESFEFWESEYKLLLPAAANQVWLCTNLSHVSHLIIVLSQMFVLLCYFSFLLGHFVTSVPL